MDPLSIIGAVTSATQGACWVSTRLYTFITSSKGVEKTLSDLQAEVEGLQGLLESVASSLKGPAAARKGSAGGEEAIWTSLDIVIKDTERTISALRGIVEALTARKSPNFFRKAIKQIKLNLDADEISDIRARIHTHTSSIQLALSMATMLISSQSSDQVINEIGPKLDRIFQDLRSSHRTTNNKLPSSFENPDIQAHTERLISSASTVIGHGSTVWGGSEMGFSHSSEAGGSLDKAKKSHIEDWIPQLTIPEEEGSQVGEPEALTAASSTLVEESGLDVEENEYSDSDGDDDYDFAEKCFEQAESYFINDEYARAVKSFRAGLKRADGLGYEKKNRLGLRNIQRELALSLMYQGELVEAEDLFQILVRSSTGDKKSVGIALHGSSGMAQVCLCRRSYVEAEDWAKKSRIGWRRAVGRRHPHYIDSLRLTAFLYELRGDLADASAYEDLVSDAEKMVDESSEVPMSLGFSADQIRKLINTYHGTHSALPEDLRNPKTPHIIRTKEVDTPNEIHEIHLQQQTSDDTAKPTSEVSVRDLRTSSQRENNTLLRFRRRSALLSSAGTGDLAALEKLLSKGVPVEAKDSEGKTALCLAVIGAHIPAIELLLKAGANVDGQDENGDTALSHAAALSRLGCTRVILTFKPNLEARNRTGQTALLRAVDFSVTVYAGPLIATVQLLLDAGANVTAVDDQGRTAIVIALQAMALRTDFDAKLVHGYPELVRILCASGVDATSRSEEGVTALSCTRQIQNAAVRRDVKKVLMMFGAT